MAKVKIKFLTFFIVIISIFSGGFGSFIFIYYFSNNLNIDNKINYTKNKTVKEIIGKNISLTDIQSNITKIVKEKSSSVVSIIIKKDLIIYKTDPWGFFSQAVGKVKEKVGGGTGFFITKDGVIITNKHVVSDRDAIYTVITSDGKEYDSKILAFDPSTDLAILKIETKDDFIPLEMIKDEKEINIGEFAIAIGNALGEFNNSVSLGVVSGKNRVINDGNIKLFGLLQTDAAINPGNSGGPLVNLDGKVIGINTAIINGSEGIGFSIILNEKKINYILDSIEKYGLIKRPFIGISYVLINDEIKNYYNLNSNIGAYIIKNENAVVSGSNADKAGIKPGDIILSIDNKIISSNNDIVDIISTKIPGDIVKLKIKREDSTIEYINLELGEI